MPLLPLMRGNCLNSCSLPINAVASVLYAFISIPLLASWRLRAALFVSVMFSLFPQYIHTHSPYMVPCTPHLSSSHQVHNSSPLQGTVGTDAWRRIGVLTFDGNIHVQVTEKVIQEYLQQKYNHKLCFP